MCFSIPFKKNKKPEVFYVSGGYRNRSVASNGSKLFGYLFVEITKGENTVQSCKSKQHIKAVNFTLNMFIVNNKDIKKNS